MNWKSLSPEELDREYSPSSMVGDITPFISSYTTESQRVRDSYGTHLITDLPYGANVEETLDLFLPTIPVDRGSIPLLIFVHGGYWQQLSKNDHSFLATAWTTAGYAFASINYGLAPTSNIPQMISRCRRAINWLGENYLHYGLDKRSIHVMGHSAGAHLLACAISPGILDHDRSALLTRPLRAILIGGIYDLEPISQTYVNEPLGLSIESARALSPQFFDTDPFVALDIVYAEHETKEFKRQSKAYADKCSKITPNIELTEVQSRHHFDIMYDIAHADTTLFQQLSANAGK
ncbi:MAG: alpha/beta hydrolase [Pseudomonadota bacterium]|nr:alpha/beta hydrolase [Pseudomonadota bacterium]MEE3282864.1 alpha/beta hydrolase [Pseudomonadota bacterium]